MRIISLDLASLTSAQAIWHSIDQPQAIHFCLHAEHVLFEAQQVLRVIPRKRMSVFGLLAGQPVLAKLFFHPTRARRHYQQEISGWHILHREHCQIADLLAIWYSPTMPCYICIFTYLAPTHTYTTYLTQALATAPPEHTQQQLLHAMQPLLHTLVKQHQVGIVQTDLHLNNFLVTNNEDPVTVYTIDLGTVRQYVQPLAKKIILQQLAILVAQLPIPIAPEIILQQYILLNNIAVSSQDLVTLNTLAQQAKQIQWQRQKTKICRRYHSSTHYAHIQQKNCHAIFARQYDSSALQTLLHHPDDWLDSPRATILKAGGSTTVGKITSEPHLLVVKRFNKFKLLRQPILLQTSRAKHNWCMAHELLFHHIYTPTPIAYREDYSFGMIKRAYFIMAYLPGLTLQQYLLAHQHDQSKIDNIMLQVQQLWQQLINLKLAQRDGKSSNLIVDEQGKLAIIDLDGITKYRLRQQLKRAWQQHARRLLQDFIAYPTLHATLSHRLFPWIQRIL